MFGTYPRNLGAQFPQTSASPDSARSDQRAYLSHNLFRPHFWMIATIETIGEPPII